MATRVEEGYPYLHVAIICMPLEKLFQSHLHPLEMKWKMLSDEQLRM